MKKIVSFLFLLSLVSIPVMAMESDSEDSFGGEDRSTRDRELEEMRTRLALLESENGRLRETTREARTIAGRFSVTDASIERVGDIPTLLLLAEDLPRGSRIPEGMVPLRGVIEKLLENGVSRDLPKIVGAVIETLLTSQREDAGRGKDKKKRKAPRSTRRFIALMRTFVEGELEDGEGDATEKVCKFVAELDLDDKYIDVERAERILCQKTDNALEALKSSRCYVRSSRHRYSSRVASTSFASSSRRSRDSSAKDDILDILSGLQGDLLDDAASDSLLQRIADGFIKQMSRNSDLTVSRKDVRRYVGYLMEHSQI